jgi:UDP-N-acetylmuramate: L-alanyl-gamma-D-glutamyl-meso-diaminopimelate ligase
MGGGRDMQDSKHIHLIGICGTAMASLAGMLQARGHRITGSDAAAYPPMSDVLADLGIPLHQPYAEVNLLPVPDLVIVGNAISRGNVELEHVLDTRIPFTSMAAVLHEEFLAGRESLVVAGTHGKTTTTSMLAWIYEFASRTAPQFAPSFLIGGVAENFGTSFMVRPLIAGIKQPFILEGDEYDTAFFDKGPKFLHYFPDAAILTHVEFDHADIYPDLAAVKTAFKRLVNLIPRRGRVVAFDGSENVSECVSRAFCVVERYGFGLDSHWRVLEMWHEGAMTRWKLLRGGKPFAELRLPMAGEHNALNATAAAALAAGNGVPVDAIVEALATFRSVKRRLEVRAEVNGITIIDDFAHHPTAIRETLRALRSSYAGRRIWALRARGFESAVFADADAIVAAIAPELRPGDVVAILSNGGFGGIYTKLPKALASR